MADVKACPFKKEANGGIKKNKVNEKAIHYSDYLQLDKILGAQEKQQDHHKAHDEHLFIVIHQNFELWFKQILYEVHSIIRYLRIGKVCERSQQTVLTRIMRVNCILRVMVQQFEILETMSCVSFASFRDVFKGGASGFQSTQFRMLEKTLGIKEEQRTCTFMKTYNERLTQEQREEIETHGNDGDNLFEVVDRWLSRTPAIRSFITSYANVIKTETAKILTEAEAEPDEDLKKELLKKAEEVESRFSIIFDSEKYKLVKKDKGANLSYDAFIGALMINCYSTEPRFSVPYEILRNFMDMDVFFTKWRFAHAMMAKRMIGSRNGTGGSGGYNYLRSTVSDRFMAFRDLFDLAAYVIAPQNIPPLTQTVSEEVSCFFVEDDYCSSDSSDE